MPHPVLHAMLPKLLFIYIHPASFVREDIRLLEEAYEVAPFEFGGAKKPGLFAFAGLLCKQLVWLLRELPGAVAVYGWFVDYHLALPVVAARCFRKPVLAVVGGFDAVSLPSLGHGVALTGWRRRIARMVFRRVDALLPVSSSLVRSKNRFSEGPEEREYGFRMLAPGIRPPLFTLSPRATIQRHGRRGPATALRLWERSGSSTRGARSRSKGSICSSMQPASCPTFVSGS